MREKPTTTSSSQWSDRSLPPLGDADSLRAYLFGKESSGALSDLVVVELCTSLAGAYGGRLLRDLGAAVLKVEPLSGDPNRRIGDRPCEGADYGALFLYANSGKHSVTLDLNTPSGAEVLQRMLDAADVVVSDMRLTELEFLGLDNVSLERRRPKLIHASVRPYGLTGPRADLPGYDLDVFEASGEGALLPGGLSYDMFPERQPLLAGRHVVSYDAGMTLATGVCAALISRSVTGLGTFFEVSQQDVQVGLVRVLLDLQLNQRVHLDRAHRGYDFGGIFPCRDGYITVRPNEDRHWTALATGMGRADLADDPRFSTRKARETNSTELNAVVREYASTRTRDQIHRELSSANAPMGTFDDPERVLRSDQFRARNWFTVSSEFGREMRLPGSPMRLSATPARPLGAAPERGAHNSDIYHLLGLDDAAQRRLREGGVI